MTTTQKHKLENSPIYFANSRTESLDEALKLFLSIFEEYAAKNELTESQVSSFKKLIFAAYKEKRATYFIENKVSIFDDYINKAFNVALRRSFDSDENDSITKVFYYNNKRRLISNEQY